MGVGVGYKSSTTKPNDSKKKQTTLVFYRLHVASALSAPICCKAFGFSRNFNNFNIVLRESQLFI